MEIDKNKEKFYQNIVDNYNSWTKPWLDNLEEISKNNIWELIKNEEELAKANDSYKKIVEHYDNIDNVYKKQKIKLRKIENVTIIVFSILIIGLFFLSFYFKNKKIIKEFDEYKKQELAKIEEQNEIKRKAFINLFSAIKKRELVNAFLSDTGLTFVGNEYGSNIEKYISNLDKNFIGLKNFGCIKVGEQNTYVGNVCDEHWEIVTTSNSVTVPYVYYVTDSDGHTHARNGFETVVGYHHENTPFRKIETITTIGFRNSHNEEDINWVLNPIVPNLKKEKNKVDHLKSKKIGSSKRDKIKNVTTFENQLFNLGYNVNIFNADGSLEQEQNILTWFTIGTQEKFVNMRTDLAEKEKFYLMDQPIYKFNNALVIKNNITIDCSWFTQGNVLNILDYEPKISLENNIENLARVGNKIAKTSLVSICEFLNFSRINSMIQMNPIRYNYSLLEPNDLNLVNNKIDSETILNMGNLTNSLNSVGEHALIDNIKTIHLDQQEKFTLAVYDIDNYFTTNEVDLVSAYAPNAKRYVTIPVSYIKYHPYTTQSTGFAIYKKFVDSTDEIVKKLDVVFSDNVFSVYDDDENIYVFFNDTDVTENNVNDILEKINLLFN